MNLVLFLYCISKVILTESMTNPRKFILCVRLQIDFVGCIVNPEFCNNSIVLSKL